MAFLKRNLGEDGIKDIQEIGKYIGKAQQKLGDDITKYGDNLVDIAKTFGIASLSSLLTPTFATAIDLGLASSYIKGYILTNKNLRHDYLNFVKALSTGSEKAIKIYSQKLNEDFEKEYGDPQDLISNPDSIL